MPYASEEIRRQRLREYNARRRALRLPDTRNKRHGGKGRASMMEKYRGPEYYVDACQGDARLGLVMAICSLLPDRRSRELWMLTYLPKTAILMGFGYPHA